MKKQGISVVLDFFKRVSGWKLNNDASNENRVREIGQHDNNAFHVREQYFCKAETIAGFGHWEYHLDDHSIVASKGASSIYGLIGTEWSLEVVKELPLPKYRERLDQLLHELIEYGEPYDIEFEINRPDDNGILWVHSIAEYDAGQRTVFGVLHDISAGKQKEIALEKSENQFKSLFSEMIDAFSQFQVICDKDGNPIHFKYLAVNPAFERMFGIKAIEVVGKTVLEVFPLIDKSLFDRFCKVALMGESIRFEHYSIASDRYYEVKAYRPVPGELATVFEDVTDGKHAEALLKASEERYATMTQTAMEGFWVVNTEGRFLEVNDAYCRTIGYSREALLSMGISDITMTESEMQTKAHIEDIKTKGWDKFEVIHRRAVNGSAKCGFSAIKVRDFGNQSAGFRQDTLGITATEVRVLTACYHKQFIRTRAGG